MKDYPTLIFTANGYANRHLPPEGMKLHPNLSIMYAPIWADTLKPFNAPNSWHGTLHGRTLKKWCDNNKRVWIYGYNYNMLVSLLTPCPTVRKISHNIKQMRDWGVVGFADETRVWPTWSTASRRTTFVPASSGTPISTWTRRSTSSSRSGTARRRNRRRRTGTRSRSRSRRSPLLGHEDRILPYVYTPELLATLEKCVAEAEKLADDGSHANCTSRWIGSSSNI